MHILILRLRFLTNMDSKDIFQFPCCQNMLMWKLKQAFVLLFGISPNHPICIPVNSIQNWICDYLLSLPSNLSWPLLKAFKVQHSYVWMTKKAKVHGQLNLCYWFHMCRAKENKTNTCCHCWLVYRVCLSDVTMIWQPCWKEERTNIT